MVKRGRPDWIRATTLQDIRDVFGNIPEVSMGELAARLGSIKTFEKRGETVFMDGFEASTLRWETAYTAGSSIVKSNAHVLTGNYSMKLTAADAESSYAHLKRKLHVPIFKRIGHEGAFTCQSPMGSILFDTYYYDRSHKWRSTVNYSEIAITPALNLLADTGWEVIDDDPIVYHSDNLFNHLKYTIDLEAKTYLTLFFNDKSYDISMHGIEQVSATSNNYMEIFIKLAGDFGYGFVSYLDNYIFTQNEP